MNSITLSELAPILLERDGVTFVRIQSESEDYGEITIGLNFEPIKNKEKWIQIHRTIHSHYLKPKTVKVNVTDGQKDSLFDIIGQYGAS